MVSSVLLSPGERIDILVDFTGLSIGSDVFLRSETFPGSVYQGKQAFNILKFTVNQKDLDTFTVPSTLSAFPVIPESQSIWNRTFDISNRGGHRGHGGGKATFIGKATIGGDSVIIKYHIPGIRNRVIWEGLVPYDKVWVTGAHDATTIEFMQPVWINGKEIPDGKYAIFTIPGRKEWIVIINKHWQQHLASEYNAEDDVLRLNVRPIKNEPMERLQYYIEDKGEGKGSIVMAWEKLKISFDIISGGLKK
jgi:hypothetical protein